MSQFPAYRQYDQMDCGLTCLRMVARHYGRSYMMESLRNRSGINREGVSLLGISEAAESIGFWDGGDQDYMGAIERIRRRCRVSCIGTRCTLWWSIVSKATGSG